MSAIAGILCFGGAPVAHGLIEAVTDTMSARGPDEQHHWVAGSIALSHCMLRTTPESFEEHQPLTSQDKSLVLVWDGRLDNRDALRRDVIAAGAVVRNNSDAELALHSYAIWGEACPTRLLGDFAFAVWDSRFSKLFCAIDHMGARPFYYAVNKRCFAFASDEEALLALPGVSGQPNESLIADVLAPSAHSYDTQYSWLRDVRGLMPGQSMHVRCDGALQTASYWHLEADEENVFASENECQEAFLEVFGEAVRCRMRSSGHIGAMMSGGLDSAGIASMAKRLMPDMPGKEIHTYSAISDHPETCVESQSILSLTRDLGGNAHLVSVPSFTGMVSVQDVIETAWSRAHPIDNSILLPAMMCLAASRRNDRVMLSGASGDMTLQAPLRYPSELLRTGQWQHAWAECQAMSRNHTFLRGASPFVLLLSNAWTAYVPGVVKALAYRMRRDGAPPPMGMLNPEFARRFQLEDRLRLQRAQHARARLTIGNHQQAYARSLSSSWGLVLGLTAYERVAGRFGVEMRDPWADKRVVEFFLRLPLRYKVRDGWTKYLVRTVFAPDMESSVRQRTGKEHLGWHFPGRLMDETDTFVARIMAQKLNVLGDYVNVKAVRARYAHYRESRDAGCGQFIDERYYFSELASLILWLDRISSRCGADK